MILARSFLLTSYGSGYILILRKSESENQNLTEVITVRVGEVNQQNYKSYLSLLGIKDSGMLDALWKKDETQGGKAGFDPKTGVLPGYEGMYVEAGDTSWHKIVPVSDEVRNKIIAEVRENYLGQRNGQLGGTDAECQEYTDNHMALVRAKPPSERLSYSWTLSQIRAQERTRLTNYIRRYNAGWEPGQPFDKSILTNSDFGVSDFGARAFDISI